jgi:maltose-binding protein MalE
VIRRKILLGLGCLLLISFFIPQIRSAASPSATSFIYLPIIIKSPTTITIWHAWTPISEEPGLFQIVDAFRTLNPAIQVVVQQKPFADDPNTPENDGLRAAFENAVVKPDIIIGPSDWGTAFLQAGYTQDLTGAVNNTVWSSLSTGAKGGVEFKGKITGLPHTIKGVVLYRNTTLISSAAATYSGFKTAAQTAGINGAILERGFFFSAAHLYKMGGSLMTATGQPNFNNSTGVAWLNLLKDFSNVGSTVYYADSDTDSFINGQAGYIIDGTWNLSSYIGEFGSNLAVDPWPTNDSGFGSGSLGGFVQTENMYLSSSATGSNRDASLQFMEFMLSQTSQTNLLNTVKHLPAINGVSVTDPVLVAAQNVLANSQPVPLDAELGFYWCNMDIALKSVFDNGADPSTALSTASTDISNSIAGNPPPACP